MTKKATRKNAKDEEKQLTKKDTDRIPAHWRITKHAIFGKVQFITLY